jgi:hypothetical protein
LVRFLASRERRGLEREKQALTSTLASTLAAT